MFFHILAIDIFDQMYWTTVPLNSDVRLSNLLYDVDYLEQSISNKISLLERQRLDYRRIEYDLFTEICSEKSKLFNLRHYTAQMGFYNHVNADNQYMVPYTINRKLGINNFILNYRFIHYPPIITFHPTWW